jgi:hypothetical protein
VGLLVGPKAADGGGDVCVGDWLRGGELPLEVEVVIGAALDEEGVVVAIVDEAADEGGFDVERFAEAVDGDSPSRATDLLQRSWTAVSVIAVAEGVWAEAGGGVSAGRTSSMRRKVSGRMFGEGRRTELPV